MSMWGKSVVTAVLLATLLFFGEPAHAHDRYCGEKTALNWNDGHVTRIKFLFAVKNGDLTYHWTKQQHPFRSPTYEKLLCKIDLG